MHPCIWIRAFKVAIENLTHTHTYNIVGDNRALANDDNQKQWKIREKERKDKKKKEEKKNDKLIDTWWLDLSDKFAFATTTTTTAVEIHVSVLLFRLFPAACVVDEESERKKM